MGEKKIIIGSSYNKKINVDFKNLINHGLNIGIPHYFIKETGRIVKIKDTSSLSRFTDTKIDNNSISIMLENSGYLNYNYFNDEYYDAFGCIYKKTNVVERVWRNKRFWSPYSEKQMESLKKLCLEICEKENITPKIVDNNIITKENNNKNIICRSNISPMFLDLNPTFDFANLKQIEQ